MIGALIFADIPLATVPEPDFGWGWNDVCPEKDVWDKQPANDGDWVKQVRHAGGWRKVQAADGGWGKVDKRSNAWLKIVPNKQDHNKC